jgi:asparagine synthase (glutamine-hydrolysing)
MESFRERQWRPISEQDDNGLVGVLYRDLTSTNLPKLLRYEDRNSMAFSLETRLPFLDYRLVEFVFSLPLSYRIHGGWSKWLLRKSFQHILPHEICWRRSKLGFPTPEFKWLQAGSTQIREVLSRWQGNPAIEKYVRSESFDIIMRSSDEKMAQTPGLWRLINFLLWYEMFVESNKA